MAVEFLLKRLVVLQANKALERKSDSVYTIFFSITRVALSSANILPISRLLKAAIHSSNMRQT
jgi:hypothetical protein